MSWMNGLASNPLISSSLKSVHDKLSQSFTSLYSGGSSDDEEEDLPPARKQGKKTAKVPLAKKKISTSILVARATKSKTKKGASTRVISTSQLTLVRPGPPLSLGPALRARQAKLDRRMMASLLSLSERLRSSLTYLGLDQTALTEEIVSQASSKWRSLTSPPASSSLPSDKPTMISVSTGLQHLPDTAQAALEEMVNAVMN